jgi:hypothetical protein
MLHKIANELKEFDCYFTPYYCHGYVKLVLKAQLLNFSILGGKFRAATERYLKENNLKLDYEGKNNFYDLVVTGSDLIIPKNIKNKNVILVQEGMTDPKNFSYHMVRLFHLPRWFGSTSTTGLSHAYVKFCVASEGYKKFFINNGCKKDKLVVTGIPNFDNCTEYLNNKFPYKDYVLVCTSDARETYKFENRKKFLKYAKSIANGRQMIFKIHPNENTKRAAKEIKTLIPDALIYTKGNTNEMIANCSVLVTIYSTVVYVGLALGKEVYSKFELEDLKKLFPIQNGGTSHINIANVCRQYL